ncbi:MAG: DUF938 domain-containing protein [Rhizobiaceae bacterium]|nr:DUF938 domain-containing protein [Rhizobiaceae bacterium]
MTQDAPFEPPFSRSADANKDHILNQLKACLNSGDRVLEIASGTGQHAAHFSINLPDMLWQSSDVDLSGYGLLQVIAANQRANLPAPLTLNIADWPNLTNKFDAVYSANCIHIIGSELLEPYVAGAAQTLKPGGLMLLYGPYKYGGNFTTQSNADFDQYLRTSNQGAASRILKRSTN